MMPKKKTVDKQKVIYLDIWFKQSLVVEFRWIAFFFFSQLLIQNPFSSLILFSTFFRKIRHKNVVQFIGARTQPPNMCIVTGRMFEILIYNLIVHSYLWFLRTVGFCVKFCNVVMREMVVMKFLKCSSLLHSFLQQLKKNL